MAARSRSPSREPAVYFLAIFQGMHQTACSPTYEGMLEQAFAAAVRRAAPGARLLTRCFSPPEPDRVWAHYAAENYAATTDVPDLAGDLQRSMGGATGPWQWFETLPPGARGAVAGISNGGKPATAAALWFDGEAHRGERRPRASVEALALVSSMPETGQQESLARHFVLRRQKKIFMTICARDNWGVDRMYAFAGRVLADVKAFGDQASQCHAKEDPQLMRKVGKDLAEQLVA